MLSRLSRLDPNKRSRRRKGCGRRGGQGKTSGRGQKGAGARVGRKIPRGYEGGQIILARRVPKRGFHNFASHLVTSINLDLLAKHYQSGERVTIASLLDKGLLRGEREALKVKILGRGELQFPLTVQVHAVSAAAKSKIMSAGGALEEI
ncbi:MAG: 50S ribosomal protein L15 [Deltaproteobacteria bacterium]|nr:50S ribosomal protein L15 [Deltaproteobacteria bacterium]